jgi:hypothetical protein
MLALATTLLFAGLLGHWWILAGIGFLGVLALLIAWFAPQPPVGDEKARLYA